MRNVHFCEQIKSKDRKLRVFPNTSKQNEFPQHTNHMGSFPSETLAVEMADTHLHSGAGAGETTEWLLNSPNPPTLWEEISGAVKENVIPKCCTKTPVSTKNNKKSTSSTSEKQSIFKTTFILLQKLFPILKLGRNYKASKFKSDVMAGLTLASLSIPQVPKNSKFLSVSLCFLFILI